MLVLEGSWQVADPDVFVDGARRFIFRVGI
jgi:hypothetical protein